MKTAITILVVFFATAVSAADQTVVRDQTGKVTGKIYHERNRDVYRDPTGKKLATATTRGGRTIYRDQHGRQVAVSKRNR